MPVTEQATNEPKACKQGQAVHACADICHWPAFAAASHHCCVTPCRRRRVPALGGSLWRRSSAVPALGAALQAGKQHTGRGTQSYAYAPPLTGPLACCPALVASVCCQLLRRYCQLPQCVPLSFNVALLTQLCPCLRYCCTSARVQGQQTGVVLHPSALLPSTPPPPLTFDPGVMAEAGGPGPAAAEYARQHAMDVHPVRLLSFGDRLLWISPFFLSCTIFFYFLCCCFLCC